VYGFGYFFAVHWQDAAYTLYMQIDSLVFLGNSIVLGAALSQLARQPQYPYQRRYRLGCVILLSTQLLSIGLAILQITATVQDRALSNIGMPLFILQYAGGSSALACIVPTKLWDKRHVLRLTIDTLIVMTTVNVVLMLLLPRIITDWSTVGLMTAQQLRLATTIGLSYWYSQVYARFIEQSSPAIRWWASGTVLLICTDLFLLWATAQMMYGASGRILGMMVPLWMLHQTCWSFGFYLGAKTPVRWRTTFPKMQAARRWGGWTGPVPQGIMLIGLVIFSSYLGASWWVTWWLGFTLVVREVLLALEHADTRRQAEALASERERNRIARELHDSVKHILVNVRWQAVVGQEISAHDPEAIPTILGEIREQAEQGLSEAHRVVHELRELGPVAPLLQRVKELDAGYHAAKIVPVVFGDERPLSAEKEDHLFRIVQEALTNVAKYAQATQVHIQIDYRNLEHMRLIIQDNGRGANELRPGVGLENMQWRAEQLGGRVEFYPNPGRGFCVVVEVPA
jgi:signal transduction histidine kinase